MHRYGMQVYAGDVLLQFRQLLARGQVLGVGDEVADGGGQESA